MMDAATQAHILDLGRQAHALTEAAYGAHAAIKGQPGWDDKQRILLADMALHLLQTALRDGAVDTATLKINLYSILTISAPFLPEKDLAQQAQTIIDA